TYWQTREAAQRNPRGEGVAQTRMVNKDRKPADQLGINRTTLYKKMKILGLDRLAS
ncbi:MAG: hypothetical protein IBJ10_10670, partial [Phycisphaerales bacterium]|nr:hypothetical protein [Phycisphaerales bacterium]